MGTAATSTAFERDPLAAAAHLASVGRAHFVGIGGTGMSGLARILKKRGYTVTGSDGKSSPATELLQNLGIPTAAGHSAAAIDFERGIVIASAAISDNNPELVRASELQIPIVKYAVALAAATAMRRVIAIAGCHGKTTTTAMTSFLLRNAGVDCGFLIGGNVPQLEGNAADGHAAEFVVEACEYDRSFLNFAPAQSGITNIDSDHLDYYGTFEAVVDAFAKFVSQTRPGGIVVTTAEAWDLLKPRVEAIESFEPRDVRIRTIGDDTKSSIRLIPLQMMTHGATRARGPAMRLFMGRDDLGAFQLGIPGAHNLINAAIAILLALEANADLEKVRAALPEFRGVDRRLTIKKRSPDITILDDYGHHPTEIRATLAAVREAYANNSRIIFVFQPHQYSRTRMLFHEFVDAIAASLTSNDRVVLPEIYAARDSNEDKESVSSADLARELRARGLDAISTKTLEQAADSVWASRQYGDVILTSGAGDVDRVADELVRRSQQN
ncbi:MAG: UDP-N-acetylmuramate--L-alanine ligase [Planctomycetota bacterium]